ncbi:HAD family hydrolase [Chloroflexota bacterium]
MAKDTVRDVVASKPVIIFDLFHTLTSLEATGRIEAKTDGAQGNSNVYSESSPGGPMTSTMLGVSPEAWNEQLLEKSRERLAGEWKDPFIFIEIMAHAIDPSIPDASIRAAVVNRISRFGQAMRGIPIEHVKVLEQLKARGKKFGLISNADVTEVAAWDESPISSIFDSTVFSCKVGYVKPEREIYEACLIELGVSAADCVYIGDGGSDELRGAKSLGMVTVMITGEVEQIWPDKLGARKKDADFVIKKLIELL